MVRGKEGRGREEEKEGALGAYTETDRPTDKHNEPTNE